MSPVDIRRQIVELLELKHLDAWQVDVGDIRTEGTFAGCVEISLFHPLAPERTLIHPANESAVELIQAELESMPMYELSQSAPASSHPDILRSLRVAFSSAEDVDEFYSAILGVLVVHGILSEDEKDWLWEASRIEWF